MADVSGHQITDALLAAMLHQAFLLGALYEMDYYGNITAKLFENLNTRFYNSSSLSKFITMIYGEISQEGTFSVFVGGTSHAAGVFAQVQRYCRCVRR